MRSPILISLPIAVLGLLISFAVTFQSIGLAEGLRIGDREFVEHKRSNGEPVIQFSGGDGNSYDHVGPLYAWMSILFGVISITTGFQLLRSKRSYGWVVLIMTCCMLISYLLSRLLRDKHAVDETFYDVSRNGFLSTTITLDWLLLGIAVSILVLQAIPIASSAMNRGRTT